MRWVKWLVLVVYLLDSFTFLANASPNKGFSINKKVLNKKALKVALKGIPVPFVENQGQINREVHYYGRTFGGTLFITKDGKLIYNLP